MKPSHLQVLVATKTILKPIHFAKSDAYIPKEHHSKSSQIRLAWAYLYSRDFDILPKEQESLEKL